MNRKIKALGLALVAALALTAVMASTASAQFTSSAATTTLHGEQTTTLQITQGTGVGAMSCATATFSGTQSGTSASTLTIKPTYGPTCVDSLGRTVHITKNTLEYHFLSGADKGKLTLTGEIEYTVTSAFGHCTITTRGHQTLNGISYMKSGNNLLITFNTNNITGEAHGGGFACGTSATHSATGTLTGSILMKGNGGAANISVD
jgi:hypothetical protein